MHAAGGPRTGRRGGWLPPVSLGRGVRGWLSGGLCGRGRLWLRGSLRGRHGHAVRSLHRRRGAWGHVGRRTARHLARRALYPPLLLGGHSLVRLLTCSELGSLGKHTNSVSNLSYVPTWFLF